MADKRTQALKRLVKKLSALRATLRKDERDLLDELVLGAPAEVAAHGMTSAVASKPVMSRAAEVAAHGMTSAVSKAASKRATEVAAHGMTSAVASKPVMSRAAEVAAHGMTSAVSKAASKRATEVAAHGMTSAKTEGAVTGAKAVASGATMRISLDAKRGVFEVVEAAAR